MSSFTDALTMTQVSADEWYRWRLERQLDYVPGAVGTRLDGELFTMEGRTTISVPVGFVTDGASVPRMLWWAFPTLGRYSRAAAVHDYLCTRLEVGTDPHPEATTFRAADRTFREAMLVLGVPLVTAWLMWLAVRAHSALR